MLFPNKELKYKIILRPDFGYRVTHAKMKWTSISQNDYQTLNYYENFIPTKLTPVERPQINLISKKSSWFKRAKGNFRDYLKF